MRVYAAAITPSELTWTPTWQTVNGEPRALTIPGHEFSGIVATVNGDSDISSGHEVFGIIDDWFADGAQAEFVAAPLRGLARKPKTVDHAQAAVIPISGLTAWQALFDRAHLQAGQRVLVHGGAGGVGSFAVQLARWKGADVTATAAAHSGDLVLRLGATMVVDYTSQRFEDVVGPVDVVIDTVGGDVLERSKHVLKPGGTIVSVARHEQIDTVLLLRSGRPPTTRGAGDAGGQRRARTARGQHHAVVACRRRLLPQATEGKGRLSGRGGRSTSGCRRDLESRGHSTDSGPAGRSSILPRMPMATSSRRLGLLLLTLCVALGWAPESRAQATAPGADPFAIPATDDGLPGSRSDPPLRLVPGAVARAALANGQEEHLKDEGAVVFLGDSITQGWGDAAADRFPGMKIANRGISGDTTRGVLIRLQEDVLVAEAAGGGAAHRHQRSRRTGDAGDRSPAT